MMFIAASIFFFLLPIFVVALSDVNLMSTARYITILIGSWIIGSGFTAIHMMNS